MADNYIGKKMDDYLSGRLRRPTVRVVGRGPKAGRREIAFEPLNVLVIGGTSEFGRAVIAELRAVGCHVAFTADADEPGANAFAQQSGARLYPIGRSLSLDNAIDDIKTHWGRLDATIAVNPSGDLPDDTITIDARRCDPAVAARFARFLLEPGNEALRQRRWDL